MPESHAVTPIKEWNELQERLKGLETQLAGRWTYIDPADVETLPEAWKWVLVSYMWDGKPCAVEAQWAEWEWFNGISYMDGLDVYAWRPLPDPAPINGE